MKAYHPLSKFVYSMCMFIVGYDMKAIFCWLTSSRQEIQEGEETSWIILKTLWIDQKFGCLDPVNYSKILMACQFQYTPLRNFSSEEQVYASWCLLHTNWKSNPAIESINRVTKSL